MNNLSQCPPSLAFVEEKKPLPSMFQIEIRVKGICRKDKQSLADPHSKVSKTEANLTNPIAMLGSLGEGAKGSRPLTRCGSDSSREILRQISKQKSTYFSVEGPCHAVISKKLSSIKNKLQI